VGEYHSFFNRDKLMPSAVFGLIQPLIRALDKVFGVIRAFGDGGIYPLRNRDDGGANAVFMPDGKGVDRFIYPVRDHLRPGQVCVGQN